MATIILRELKEGDDVLVTGHWRYYDMARSALAAARAAWDRTEVLAASSEHELILKFVEAVREGISQNIAATLFIGLATEAYINHFIHTKVTDKMELAELDKLSVVAKWTICPRLLCQDHAKANINVFRQLKSVAQARNELVHFKPKIAPYKQLAGRRQELTEAERLMKLLEQAILELQKIDPAFEQDSVSYFLKGGRA